MIKGIFARLRRIPKTSWAIILTIAILSLSVPTYAGYQYAQNDPKFCASCHLMKEPYETWRTSAMHTQTCHVCHELPPTEGMSLLFTSIVAPPSNITKHAVVNPEVCLKCHASQDPQWKQIENTTGHQVHYYQQKIECTQCHGVELHQFTPSKELCQQCHSDKVVKVKQMQFHCLTCHKYTESGESLKPTKAECQLCHTGRTTTTVSFPADAHTDSDCTTCHEPHEQSAPVECTTCHTAPTTGIHQTSSHTTSPIECTSCHKPHSVNEVRATCLSCHTDKGAHYAPVQCNLCHK